MTLAAFSKPPNIIECMSNWAAWNRGLVGSLHTAGHATRKPPTTTAARNWGGLEIIGPIGKGGLIIRCTTTWLFEHHFDTVIIASASTIHQHTISNTTGSIKSNLA